jgi:hypothetical protein
MVAQAVDAARENADQASFGNTREHARLTILVRF